jgi:serine/threonine protein kinase/Flp pilus assembly protein TadD
MAPTSIRGDEGFKGLFPIGTLIHSRYEILSEGKMGGMGMVYKCRDTRHTRLREVALKLMQPKLLDSKEAVERFQHEASISRDLLHHHNIVRVFHDDEWEDEDGITWYYLLMEWVEGRNLRDLINERKKVNKPFSVKEAHRIISQLAEALTYAHSHTEKVIHRDVKPENILFTDEATLSLKLADFGIAKILKFQETTQIQTPLGTSPYMSPELKAGGNDVDHRSDIYSVGVVLYELLTLENSIGPFCPSELNSTIPRGIDAIYKKGVAPRAEQRYQSIKDLSDDLLLQAEGGNKGWDENVVEAITQPREIKTPPKRKRFERYAFAALAAMILVGAAGAFWAYKTARQETALQRLPQAVVQETKKEKEPQPIAAAPKPAEPQPEARKEPKEEPKEEKWIDWRKAKGKKAPPIRPKPIEKAPAQVSPPVIAESELLPLPKIKPGDEGPVAVPAPAPSPGPSAVPRKEPEPKLPPYPKVQPRDEARSPARLESAANEYFSRAYRAMKSGDLHRAAGDFTRAIDLNPGHELSYHYRGVTYFRLSNFVKAIDDFTKAADLRPTDVYFHWRGMAYYKLSNFYRAADDFTRAIELKNDDLYFHWRGMASYKLGNYHKAVDDFTTAIRMKPNNQAGYLYFHWRGMAYYKLSNFYGAIDDFTRAIRLKPNDLDYRWRGTCYQRLGRRMEADTDFGMAARLGSESGRRSGNVERRPGIY